MSQPKKIIFFYKFFRLYKNERLEALGKAIMITCGYKIAIEPMNKVDASRLRVIAPFDKIVANTV